MGVDHLSRSDLSEIADGQEAIRPQYPALVLHPRGGQGDDRRPPSWAGRRADRRRDTDRAAARRPAQLSQPPATLSALSRCRFATRVYPPAQRSQVTAPTPARTFSTTPESSHPGPIADREALDDIGTAHSNPRRNRAAGRADDLLRQAPAETGRALGRGMRGFRDAIQPERLPGRCRRRRGSDALCRCESRQAPNRGA
jgi:hypothetical protein